MIQAHRISTKAPSEASLISGSLGFGARVRVVLSMLERDLYVLSRSWKYVVLRVAMQPLMFIFIFAYIFPLVGQGIGGTAGSTRFSTLLVPGTLAMTMFLNGIQAVTIPLINDLGMTREIEDRILSPLPLTWIVGEKIVEGATEACISGLVVIPCAILIPSTSIHLDISWYAAIPSAVLVALVGSAFGLFLGVRVRPSQLQAMFALLILPISFLGATYYPWESLSHVPWLKWAMVVNPLVFANEALRASISPGIPHMAESISVPILASFGIAFSVAGMRGLKKRLVL